MLIAEEKLHAAEARALRAEADNARLSAESGSAASLQAQLEQWQKQVMVRLHQQLHKQIPFYKPFC